MLTTSSTRVIPAVFFVVLASAVFAQTDVTVDAGSPAAEISRELFSITNFQYLWANGNGKAIEQFADLAPAGMQQRIEARISDAEPENDNQDPLELNAQGFFRDRLLVSVGDPDRFLDDVGELGMEIVLLLGYNAAWLSTDGRLTGPPHTVAEWVEFARAAVNTVNSAGGPSVRYVEVWNEPNIPQFFTGTREQYFELFNAVADALHAEFPGILVGGPALSPGGPVESWVVDFLEACGSRADFLSYHSYGQAVPRIVADIARYSRMFRERTGKSGPRIMITESDHRVAPEEKFAYLVKRQLALLELQDDVLGFHHFTLPYYEEGAFVFGLIHTDAGIVGENYWPYWLFRHFIGFAAPVERTGAREIETVASVSHDRGTISVITTNFGEEETSVRLDLRLPDARERLVAGFVVDEHGPELVVNQSVNAARYRTTLDLPAGSVATVTLAPPEVAQPVWVEIDVDTDAVLVGETVTATITLTNLLQEEIRGKVMIVGNPQDWEITSLNDDGFYPLPSGETLSYQAELQTTAPTELGGAAVYGLASFRRPRTRSIRIGSAPVRVEALAPLTLQAKPLQLWVRPGETGAVSVTAENTYNEQIAGQISLEPPHGWSSEPMGSYGLEVGERSRYSARLTVPAAAQPGEYQAQVAFDYQGNRFSTPFTISVRNYEDKESTPVDLRGFYDSDLFTAPDDFSDVSNFGGPFSYPARFFPSNQMVEYLGVTFAFPNTATGHLNAVRSAGQEVPVPAGSYEQLYFLSAATNGDKTALVTLHYADGSSTTHDPVITDWCVDSRHEGELEIAKAPYRHLTNGVLRDALPRITYHGIPVDPEKRLVRVEFPPERDYWIIAMTLTR